MLDLLELDGDDLRRKPREFRRDKLVILLREPDNGIRVSEHLDRGSGETVFRIACKLGLRALSPSGEIEHIDRDGLPMDQSEESERTGRHQADRGVTCVDVIFSEVDDLISHALAFARMMIASCKI